MGTFLFFYFSITIIFYFSIVFGCLLLLTFYFIMYDVLNFPLALIKNPSPLSKEKSILFL